MTKRFIFMTNRLFTCLQKQILSISHSIFCFLKYIKWASRTIILLIQTLNQNRFSFNDNLPTLCTMSPLEAGGLIITSSVYNVTSLLYFRLIKPRSYSEPVSIRVEHVWYFRWVMGQGSRFPRMPVNRLHAGYILKINSLPIFNH